MSGPVNGRWWPLLATVAALICLPCLHLGLLYKRLWYSSLVAGDGASSNCTCPCYDGFIEGRAYYSQGRPQFYSSAYRYVYINSEPVSALLLSLMACSVLLLHRAVEALWRLPAWRKSTVAALAVNLLLAYDLFWSTFQAANAGRAAAALHYGAFYGLQCCLCWALILLTECPRSPAPLALNWAALLTCAPLLIKATNLLTLLQYVSRRVLVRDYLSALGHSAGHLATVALLARLPVAEWKLLMGSSRLLSLDACCVVAMWLFNILT